MAGKPRGFYGPSGRLHGRKPIKPPSQASGLAPGYIAPGGPGSKTDQLDKAIKKKARNIGNALLPGNPFG